MKALFTSVEHQKHFTCDVCHSGKQGTVCTGSTLSSFVAQ